VIAAIHRSAPALTKPLRSSSLQAPNPVAAVLASAHRASSWRLFVHLPPGPAAHNHDMAWRSSGATNRDLVENLWKNGLIKHIRVKDAFLEVG